jgi:hypothetical protein
VTDFSVEFDQALMYKDMAPEIEQIYLMSDLKFVFVRAARIRESRSPRPRCRSPRPRTCRSRAPRDLAVEVVAIRSTNCAMPPNAGSERMITTERGRRFIRQSRAHEFSGSQDRLCGFG